jgi:hypothetical protein
VGCNCRKSRPPAGGGSYTGYYVVLPDQTEVPKVSQGEAPFSWAMEARVEIRRAGGGTMRTMIRNAAR